MNMPAFTAQSSLYLSGQSYCGGIDASGSAAAADVVVAQQAPGCTVSCSDWIGCNNKCGAWPPGFTNYQCWLDCLKPTVDCLQGATCFPPPLDCTTTGCSKPGQVCCDCVSPARCVTPTYCRNVLCRL